MIQEVDGMTFLEKVNKLLDAFEEKAASLQAAKENGDSNQNENDIHSHSFSSQK